MGPSAHRFVARALLVTAVATVAWLTASQAGAQVVYGVRRTAVVATPGGTAVVSRNTAVVAAPAPVAVVAPLPAGYIAVLPTGYRPVVVSGVRYYTVGGVYYRPQFYGGRTVYVRVRL
jgi:hypothetical protein